MYNNTDYLQIKSSESSIGSLWKAQTKNTKIDYFFKNISPPTVFKQLFSNLHSLIFIQ